MNPAELRAQIPVLKKRAYMFSGGIAPASNRHIASMKKHMDDITNDPDGLYLHTEDAMHECRALFAKLMGADKDEIAFVESTSAGSNLAVDMLTPAPNGKNVVLDDYAYPSSVYPWKLKGRENVALRFVQARDGIIPFEDMEAAVDKNTIAVSVSHVTPGQGFRHDLGKLAKLAHAHGAVLIVDGAQSAGAMDINLHALGVDFYSTTAMKWLMGASGVGFFYCAKKHFDKVPTRAGYSSNAMGYDIHKFAFRNDAERFHLGLSNIPGAMFTKPGLELLLEVGTKVVEKHVNDLAGYAIRGMKERGIDVITPDEPKYHQGVIAAIVPEAVKFWKFLYDRGVDTYYHGDLFRVDPHVFNNRADVDRLFEGIEAYGPKLRK
ncbi:MAG: aminotransferase class V-fold PLP-dependent enzyme [SAR202 cluster bacterium]|nr:aminotransferase class V-fold PLP-dependent enzyme [SAR202 cluster bacterium]